MEIVEIVETEGIVETEEIVDIEEIEELEEIEDVGVKEWMKEFSSNLTLISEALRCVSLNRSTSTAHAAVSDPAADPSVEACADLCSVLLAGEGTLIVPFVVPFVVTLLVTLLAELLMVLLTEFEAAATWMVASPAIALQYRTVYRPSPQSRSSTRSSGDPAMRGSQRELPVAPIVAPIVADDVAVASRPILRAPGRAALVKK